MKLLHYRKNKLKHWHLPALCFCTLFHLPWCLWSTFIQTSSHIFFFNIKFEYSLIDLLYRHGRSSISLISLTLWIATSPGSSGDISPGGISNRHDCPFNATCGVWWPRTRRSNCGRGEPTSTRQSCAIVCPRGLPRGKLICRVCEHVQIYVKIKKRFLLFRLINIEFSPHYNWLDIDITTYPICHQQKKLKLSVKPQIAWLTFDRV